MPQNHGNVHAFDGRDKSLGYVPTYSPADAMIIQKLRQDMEDARSRNVGGTPLVDLSLVDGEFELVDEEVGIEIDDDMLSKNPLTPSDLAALDSAGIDWCWCIERDGGVRPEE